jgi:hypothetical protein
MLRPALILAAVSTLPAFAAISPPSGVAPGLTPPAGEVAAFSLRAEGVHVFECKPLATDPNRYLWSFSAPESTLYDSGRPVARLTAENGFEALADRSSVSAVVRARQNAGASIPWLLLRAQSTPDTGLFAGVTSIQRVNTSGGVAPAGGCDELNVGKEARAPFTAEYYFYRRAA